MRRPCPKTNKKNPAPGGPRRRRPRHCGRFMDNVEIAACGAAPSNGHDGLLLRYIKKLPRPIRFLAVGSAGFLTDLAVFTLIFGAGTHPLRARLVSLAVATVLTWRGDRALPFVPPRRAPRQGAA